MPDVEDTELPLGEHQPAAIGRDPRQGDAAVAGHGIIDEFAWTEGEGLLVEGFTVEVILHLLVVLDELEVHVDRIALLPVAAHIIDVLAVGAPEGEAVEVCGVTGDGRDLVGLQIVEDEVALGVLHLYLLHVACVEALACAVGGIDNPRLRRMPGGIDACGEGAVCLEVDLLELAVVGDDGASEVLADVELDALRVVPL